MRLASMLLGLTFAFISDQALAQIKLTELPGNDHLYFHGQIYNPTFVPSTSEIRFELWNSHGLVYSQTLPAGTCVDSGSGCLYKNQEAQKSKSGVQYFRVLYQTRSHGHKMWLESYQEFVSVDDPEMTFMMFMNGSLFASIPNATFTRRPRGWIFRF